RELLARVESHIKLQNERQRSAERLEELILLERHARASAEIANQVKDEFLAMLSHELRTPLNDCVEWRAQFVREHRQKLVLNLVCDFRARACVSFEQDELFESLRGTLTLILKFDMRLDPRQQLARGE